MKNPLNKNALKATTPFPNHILDEIMPRLKDTEWRLLCVIVRQTLGWHSQRTQSRKVSDWLTQAQLVQKTGRDRAALSRALDILVRANYIEARNDANRLLPSPSQRRQNKGRIFYGLHPRLLGNLQGNDSTVKSEYDKSEYQTPVSNSLLERTAVNSEYHPAPKANTTKETETKENKTKGISENFWESEAIRLFHSQEPIDQPTTYQTALPLNKLPLNGCEYSSAVRDFIARFERCHEQAKEQPANILLTLEETARLEKLLKSHPLFDWTPILEAFFSSEAGYIVRRKHSLPVFLDSCHIFLIKRMSYATKRT